MEKGVEHHPRNRRAGPWLFPVSERRSVTGWPVSPLGLGSRALVLALLPIGPVRHDIRRPFHVPPRIGSRVRLALSEPLFCLPQLKRRAEHLSLCSPCFLQRGLLPLQRGLLPLSRRPGLQQVREHASESDDPTKNAENLLNHPSSI